MVHEAQLLCACSGVERDGWNKDDKIVHLACEQVGNTLRFTFFLIFHCPVKEDAVETLRVFADLSHRVSHKMTVISSYMYHLLAVYHDYR